VSDWIFPFRKGEAGLPENAVERLGRKGANLAAMCRLGLPVPPGFTVSVELCRQFLHGGKLPPEFGIALGEGIAFLEEATLRRFGGARRPLLLSARSGAATSMPGMLETILNLGLNETSVEGLMRHSGNPRFAWDSFRRLVAMYGSVVRGIPRSEFDRLLQEAKRSVGVLEDHELDSKSLEALTRASLGLYERRACEPFPMDPLVQLQEAIAAVFRSWESDRAREYRRIHGIDAEGGTATTIQAMVFGNSGGRSGTGVAFTRDPVSGLDSFYMDFLFNAQGEDIVAGVRTPQTGSEFARELPTAWAELEQVRRTLEGEFRDMQDIEFTVEDGSLYILQTRTGKRSAISAMRIAIDFVQEGRITPAEALQRLRSVDPRGLRLARLADGAHPAPLAVANSACSGVAVGRVALTSERAVELQAAGVKVILVRGGRTSHAAVVARQMGVPCLVGCRDLVIHQLRSTIEMRGVEIREGESLTIDATSGRVYPGELLVSDQTAPAELAIVREWIAATGETDHPWADMTRAATSGA
jgi:pyruvate,orthophosphate dikinase